MRFGYVPIASKLLDEATREGLLVAYQPLLEELGGERWSPGRVGRPDPLLLFVLTGGTEQQILRLWEERRQVIPNEPALLLAHPGNNALPAALEVLARLQQDGQRGQILYLADREDQAGRRRLLQAVHDLKVYRALRQTRLGSVGEPSDWLVASRPDRATVRQTWGPEVVTIDMEELLTAIETVSQDTLRPMLDALLVGAMEVREPSLEDLEEAVRVYWALRGIVERYRLDAVTVRCFDLVQRKATTGCFALSQLADEGIMAGCEGDLVSTVGMTWVHQLLGQGCWMANPARVEVAEDRLWLAHCTVPRRMAGRYRLRSHFESGLGVGIEGQIQEGPVTLLRVGGKDMERLWLAEGTVQGRGQEEILCRTQVVVELEEGVVAELLRSPLGNHVLLLRGHRAERLRDWWLLYGPGARS